MKTYTISTLVLLGLILTVAPAAAQNKEHMQMEAELRMLQEQNQQLAVAFQQSMDAIKAVNTRFDATMEALRKGFADQQLATKNMAGDVSTIAERARDTDSELRKLRDEINALQTTLTTLAGSMQTGSLAAPTVLDPLVPAGAPGAPGATTGPAGAAVPPLAVPPAVPPSAPAAGASPNTLGLSPTRMLQLSKGDYDAGQYTLAITGFEQLIKTFPDSEAAVEAQYWIGESQLYQSRFREAIAAFNLALQKGTRFAYAPDALYKRGSAQERLGDLAGARASYDQVIRQFPQNTNATLAQQRLNRLGPAPGAAAPARP